MMTLDANAASDEERLKNRLTLKIPREELGDIFKVLIQTKGVDNPRLLCMREWGKDL